MSKPSISESIAPLDIPQARRYFSFHPQLPNESAPEPRRRHRPKSPSAVPGNKAGHLRNSRARPLPMIRHLRFSYTIYRENFRTKGCCRSSFSSWQPMPAKCPHPASSLRFCFPLPVPQRRSGRMPKKNHAVAHHSTECSGTGCLFGTVGGQRPCTCVLQSGRIFRRIDLLFISNSGLIIYLLGSAAGIFARRYPPAIHSQSIFTCGQNPNRPVCRDFGLILL